MSFAWAPPARRSRGRSAAIVVAGLAMAFAMDAAATAAEPETATGAPAAAEPLPASRWTTSSQLSGADYRWSMSRGAVDLGLRFDVVSASRVGFDRRLEPIGPYAQTLPALSLGLRRLELGPGTLLKDLSSADVATATSHRVGIEWKPADSQLLFLRQGLGVRLSGDDRLTMRLKKGTLGIYMKQDF